MRLDTRKLRLLCGYMLNVLWIRWIILHTFSPSQHPERSARRAGVEIHPNHPIWRFLFYIRTLPCKGVMFGYALKSHIYWKGDGKESDVAVSCSILCIESKARRIWLYKKTVALTQTTLTKQTTPMIGYDVLGEVSYCSYLYARKY